MANEQQQQQQQQFHRRTLETRSSAYDEEEEELQLEVKNMAESILHYRTTLPNQLNKTFGSLITTQRPFLLPPSQMTTTEYGTSNGDQNPEVALLDEEEDLETAEKIRLLKLKISSNISAIPIILERMKETISRIDKLELHKVIKGCRQFKGFLPPNKDEDDQGEGQQLQISQVVSSRSSSSLQSFKLYDCPALRLFPNIRSLTSLRALEIQECKISKSLQDELTCLSSSLEHLEHVKF